ncbi:MAG: cell division protein FtsA [Candidatus Delongbacteria bacterium]|jgi:cell division protein FtsA|nr:cell division protein FtsA [Candidatus Delongbacteria bacterium]
MMQYNTNPMLSVIDIGTTKIVALTGQKNEEGRFEIHGMGKRPSYGVRRGLVMNIEETVAAITEAVNELKACTGKEIDEVVIGIAGQHVKSMKNSIKSEIRSGDGVVSEDDVICMIQKMYKSQVGAGEQILHVIPQSFKLDGKNCITDPKGWFAKEMEAVFHVIVGKINSMENIKNCVNRAGFDVKRLMLEPLASADAVLSKREKEMGVAMVDIGGGTTDMAVFYNEVLQHTAVIPFGGNAVTADIKQGFSVLQSQAENLKIEYGTALQSKSQKDIMIQVPGLKGREERKILLNKLVYVIQERMKEIVYAIKFQIEESGYADKINAGIVLTGGGALLKNLPQLVTAITGYDVIIGFPREHITGEYAKAVNQPMFATSVGLMMKYDMLLNDIPPEWDENILQYDIKEPENDEDEDNDEKESKKSTKSSGSIFKKFTSKIKTMLDEEEDDFEN